MKTKMNAKQMFILTVAMGICTAGSVSNAAYVTPAIGGGQVGMMQAPMIHSDIGFDGTNISVDTMTGTVVLRPLTGTDQFDPAQSWSVLSGKAYNFQYAWNSAITLDNPLPAGTWVWVKRLSHTTGLETYLRPPATPSYAPVFQNDGDIWRWNGGMTHNAYAVQNPTLPFYTANYEVYVGDLNTGVPIPGYGSANVSWTFVPEPTCLGLLGIGGMALLRRRRV